MLHMNLSCILIPFFLYVTLWMPNKGMCHVLFSSALILLWLDVLENWNIIFLRTVNTGKSGYLKGILMPDAYSTRADGDWKSHITHGVLNIIWWSDVVQISCVAESVMISMHSFLLFNGSLVRGYGWAVRSGQTNLGDRRLQCLYASIECSIDWWIDWWVQSKCS